MLLCWIYDQKLDIAEPIPYTLLHKVINSDRHQCAHVIPECSPGLGGKGIRFLLGDFESGVSYMPYSLTQKEQRN